MAESEAVLSSDWSAADPGRGLRLWRRDLQPPGAGGEEGAGRQAGAGAGGRQGGALLALELATFHSVKSSYYHFQN